MLPITIFMRNTHLRATSSAAFGRRCAAASQRERHREERAAGGMKLLLKCLPRGMPPSVIN